VSKQKFDYVYDTYYRDHLNGGRRNPSNNVQWLTQSMYETKLIELCSNRFEWVGLPDTVDRRHLEMSLLGGGLAVFFFDKQFSRYLALAAAGVGKINMYGNPVSFTIARPNMRSITLSGKTCVPIWANYTRTSEMAFIRLYAKKLAGLDRSIEIVTESMRYSKLVQVKEEERLSYVNILRQHAEGQPVIFGVRQDGIDMMDQISVFDLGVPQHALTDLRSERIKLWNECMGMLGINNANQEKKERLVESEVSANDEQVDLMKNVALNARRQGAEQINRMYPGLKVSVHYASDVPQNYYLPSLNDMDKSEELQDEGEKPEPEKKEIES